MKTCHFRMDKLKISFIAIVFGMASVTCQQPKDQQPYFVSQNIEFAAAQQKLQVETIEQSGKILNPRTVNNDKIRYMGRGKEDWTSGFFYPVRCG